MAQPYVGEIRMFAGNFPPAGWLFCSGQQLPISENETLFQLIGTTYGGDGESSFNLPNLQSRIPIHMGTATSGTTYTIAEMSGVEEVTLSIQQIPSHTHPLVATNDSGNQLIAGNAVLAAQSPVSIYRPNATPPNSAMNVNSVSVTGGSQPHENMQPFLCINYIISLFGLFPNPN
ncbi:MAG TPA: tail fiber protein [Allosphingosinicella sp.]|jgi:microcystin-dependent protein